MAQQGISPAEICESGYTKKVRNVNKYTKRRVFRAYGLSNGIKRGYEVDHIISLELGGTNDLDNLFPQPYEAYLSVNHVNMRMGAHEKDKVENDLHRKVCQGKMSLHQAQDIIVNDWVTYYLKMKKKL